MSGYGDLPMYSDFQSFLTVDENGDDIAEAASIYNDGEEETGEVESYRSVLSVVHGILEHEREVYEDRDTPLQGREAMSLAEILGYSGRASPIV